MPLESSLQIELQHAGQHTPPLYRHQVARPLKRPLYTLENCTTGGFRGGRESSAERFPTPALHQQADRRITTNGRRQHGRTSVSSLSTPYFSLPSF